METRHPLILYGVFTEVTDASQDRHPTFGCVSYVIKTTAPIFCSKVLDKRFLDYGGKEPAILLHIFPRISGRKCGDGECTLHLPRNTAGTLLQWNIKLVQLQSGEEGLGSPRWLHPPRPRHHKFLLVDWRSLPGRYGASVAMQLQ